MSTPSEHPQAVLALAIITRHFREFPFHNLRLLFGEEAAASIPGGTCSDKAQAFLKDARDAGLEAHLHTALIDGEEKHRLVRLSIGGQTYFADVGDGWPTLQLIPASHETQFEVFGIRFRTEFRPAGLAILNARAGREVEQCTILAQRRSEAEITAQILRRFDGSKVYPFSGAVRFSALVDDRFLFLRGTQLISLERNGTEKVTGFLLEDTPAIIHDYFGYRLTSESAFRVPS